MTFTGKHKPASVNKYNILFIASLVILFLFELNSLNFFRINFDYLIDSDMSSELVLSRLMSEEGTFLTDKWYYSTELRVLSIDLVFAPLFKIFSSWHRIRLTGTAILHLLMVLSSFLLCRSAGKTSLFPFISLGLLVPLSEDYLKYTLLNSCYVPYIVISLCGLALVLSYLKDDTKKRFVFPVLSVILAFLSCMGGARQMLVLYIPLAVCALIEISAAFFMREKLDLKNLSVRLSITALLSAVSAAAGYYVNTHILAEKYSFVTWEGFKITGFNDDGMLTAFNGILSTLGFIAGPVDAYRVVSDGVSLILLLLGIVSVVYGICKTRKNDPGYYVLSLFTACAAVVYLLFYSFTDMVHEVRYNIPVVILFFVTTAFFLSHIKERCGLVRMTVPYCLIIITMIISGLMTFDVYGANYKQRDRDFISFIDQMADDGYVAGYSSFWNANVVTELSDGRIDMRAFADFKNPAEMYYMTSINQTYHWLAVKDHDTSRPLEGKVCIILSPDEYANCLWKDDLAGNIIYSSDEYVIFGFEDYYEMLGVIGSYHYAFEGEFVNGGSDEEGERTLLPGGFTFGPYITFYEGTYRLTLKGEGLDNASIDCTTFNGSNHLEYRTVSSSDEEVIIEFSLDCDHYQGETAVYNTSQTQSITLIEMSLEYISRSDK